MLYHLLVLHRYISKGGNKEGEQRKKILGKRGRVRMKRIERDVMNIPGPCIVWRHVAFA